MAYNLSVWFMEVYGDWGYIADNSVMPEEKAIPDYEAIIKEQAETASESMELSEAETRYLIDEQFRRCSWEADTNNIRYSKEAKPQKGRNLAIMP